MKNNDKWIFIGIVAALVAGCTDDSKSSDPVTTVCDPACAEGYVCVDGSCKPEGSVCNPACDPATQDCIDGTCQTKSDVCNPACDAEKQKCENHQCVYVDPYCAPQSCSEDATKRCKDDATWEPCVEGESCYRGVCIPQEVKPDCVEGSCDGETRACYKGTWKDCSSVEQCVAGVCLPKIDSCDANTCIEDDASYYCDADGKPQKCKVGWECRNGACERTNDDAGSLLWTLCDVNSDCSFGYCLKSITLSHAIDDPEQAGHQISEISVSRIDKRIPSGRGICSADCTNDSGVCDGLSLGDRAFSCQLVYEEKSPYPPIYDDGRERPLPFSKYLDTAAMERGIGFGAICRPFVAEGGAYGSSFGQVCEKQSDCGSDLECVDGVCTSSCSDDEMCPLTFSCASDQDDRGVCSPVHGTFGACRDKDGDGYGVGHCKYKAVDCDDADAGAFYNTDLPAICEVGKDRNCNGRKDEHELLGTAKYCESCTQSCSLAASTLNLARACYKDNGGVDLDDYKDETYTFSCLEACAPGYADCDGNAANGCEVNLIDKENQAYTEPSLLATDKDGDGFGSSQLNDRAWCCSGANGKCYGYIQHENPSIAERQWLEITDKSGYIADLRDCNDDDPAINPNAKELCDGIDNNCNGAVDEIENMVDGNGQAVVVDCDTGKAGVCTEGKNKCLEYTPIEQDKPSTFAISCEPINPGSQEYCNGVDDGCVTHAEIKMVVAISNGKPIYDEGKGYKLISKDDAVSANYICQVDPALYPNAKGLCAFGRYTCDTSKANKTGKLTDEADLKSVVYCKPFEPQLFDFIGDGIDANCDGFDGDLSQTLFIGTNATQTTQVIHTATDNYTVANLREFSQQKLLHKNPLKTLSKAMEFIEKCEDGAGCTVRYYDRRRGIVVAKETDCEVANMCPKLVTSWDIVVAQGGVNDFEPSRGNIVYSTKNMTKYNSTDTIKFDTVVKNGTQAFELAKVPMLAHPAWARIYGGYSLTVDKTKEDIVWAPPQSNAQSALSFKFEPKDFVTDAHVTSILNANAKDMSSLYMSNVSLNATVNTPIDPLKYMANRKTPNTFVGINAMGTSMLELVNVGINLTAPSGADGVVGADGAAANNADYDKDGEDAFAKIYTLNANDWEFVKKRYNNGKVIKKGTLNNTIPKCNNGGSINPSRPGGYVGTMLYEDKENVQTSMFNYNLELMTLGNFKDAFKIGEEIADAWDESKAELRLEQEVGTFDKNFEHLFGVSSGGALNKIGPKQNFPKSLYRYAGRKVNAKYTDYMMVCSSYMPLSFGECPFKFDKTTVNEEEIQKLASAFKFPGVSSKEHREFFELSKDLEYYDNYFGSTREPYAEASNGGLAGVVDDKVMELKNANNSNYYFESTNSLETLNGKNGENGKSGAGVPPFYPSTTVLGGVDIIGRQANFGGEMTSRFYPRLYDGDFKVSRNYKYSFAKKNSDTSTLQVEYDYQSYRFSIMNYLYGIYVNPAYLYLWSEFDNDRVLARNNGIGFVSGASGGAGGCGGLGGGGGRHGATAIGIVYSPTKENATQKARLSLVNNVKMSINGGSGGSGANGGNGMDGGRGGSGIDFAGRGQYAPNDFDHKGYGSFKAINAFGGMGGTGGGAGAGGKGGYALGVMIDCSVESSKTYADCEKKLGLELPTSFGAYQTKLGTNAYVVGKAPGKGEANVVVKDQNAGRGTAGGEAYHNTTLQAHEQINATASDAVYSDSQVVFVYDNGKGGKELGSKDRK